MTSTADYLSGLATPLNADVELREVRSVAQSCERTESDGRRYLMDADCPSIAHHRALPIGFHTEHPRGRKRVGNVGGRMPWNRI